MMLQRSVARVGGRSCFVLGCLVDIPASVQVYIRHGSAVTVLCAATLRQELHYTLTIH